jgi:hypothetical protein
LTSIAAVMMPSQLIQRPMNSTLDEFIAHGKTPVFDHDVAGGG